MARKHNHPRVHYGTPRRGTLCGLPYPRIGAGATECRDNVTCQGCAAVLEATSPPKEIDAHAVREYRVAWNEYALAMGAGNIRPARWLGHQQANQAVPVR